MPHFVFHLPFCGARDWYYPIHFAARRCDSVRAVSVPGGGDRGRLVGSHLAVGPADVRAWGPRAAGSRGLPNHAGGDADDLANGQDCPVWQRFRGRITSYPCMAASWLSIPMTWPIETIDELAAGCERIRVRRYGVIETAAGALQGVHLRPWPKLLAAPELLPLGPNYHQRGAADRCLLYFNQPRRMPNFLALKYIVTTFGTSFRTFRAALAAMDIVAEIKQIDAIVCDAANVRLSDRVMARLGWEPHKPQRWHRNFIRRFYGKYPAHENAIDMLAKPQAAVAAESFDAKFAAGLSR